MKKEGLMKINLGFFGNSLEYPPVITQALDALYVQEATSGWMQENASQIRYMGGREIKVPTRSMTGLGDYNRPDGKYPKGSIVTSYQTKHLTQDRSTEFYFDRNDVDETDYLNEATNVMGQFTKEHVAPELDAFRYSSIAKAAIAASRSEDYTPSAANIFTRLLSNLREIQDSTGVAMTDIIITMPYTVYGILEQSKEFNGSLIPTNFTQGDITFEVRSINGAPIIPVTSSRMKTDFDFASGENELGFSPAAGAKDINWLITPKDTPIAVTKTDSLKIFDPDTNQDGDGWKTQYRIYHDLFILDNKMNGIFASIDA